MPEHSGPIFVLGSQGSGTTLLRLMLDSHDDVAMAQETAFARSVLAIEQIPFYETGTGWHTRIGLSRDELEARIRTFYDGLFGDFAARRGATRWGDKTPAHVWHMELLARVFPDAVFVGMVRHPGAGASSRSRRMGHSFDSSVRQWTRRNTEMLHVGARLGDRFALLRYEDLVTQPEPLLRELLEWLGLPWTDRVLEFHRVHQERGTPTQVEGYTLSDEPVDDRRVGAWAAGMDAARWARLTRRRVRALCRLLGYRPREPRPVTGWRDAADGFLLDGDGLKILLGRYPRVAQAQRPRPALADRPLDHRELPRLHRATADARRRGARAGGRLGVAVGSVGHRVLQRLPVRGRRRVRTVVWSVRDRRRRG